MSCGKALKIKKQELLTHLEGSLLKTIAYIISPAAALVAKNLRSIKVLVIVRSFYTNGIIKYAEICFPLA